MNTFLNGILIEEHYIKQAKGFIDPYLPNHVFKFKDALYVLKQALRAWNRILTVFFLKGYKRWRINKTLFIGQLKSGLIVSQVYVDDIVFRSTSEIKFREFVALM